MNIPSERKEAGDVILEYGEDSNFDSGYFLTYTHFSIMAGFKLNLLRKVVNSLKFYNVVNLDIFVLDRKERKFLCSSL
jgi:hypothetical protein